MFTLWKQEELTFNLERLFSLWHAQRSVSTPTFSLLDKIQIKVHPLKDQSHYARMHSANTDRGSEYVYELRSNEQLWVLEFMHRQLQ